MSRGIDNGYVETLSEDIRAGGLPLVEGGDVMSDEVGD